MFELSKKEFADWRSQFVTSNSDKMGLRYSPMAFTEQGVAMLSSVLRMGIPDFAVTGIKAAYLGDVPDNFEDEWSILPACKGPGCNGIEIPAGARTDELNAILYEISSPVTVLEQVKQERPVLPQVLMKGWAPNDEVDRLSEKNELAVWNKLIEPIVKLHYKGAIHYKCIDGSKKITPDNFGALWEQYLAPVICFNIPSRVEYPQTMDQGELESRICENVWEPETFGCLDQKFVT
jgi:hypothetical protein